jgi:hypothetical protein
MAGSTQPTADYNPATPGYFAALRIPFIEGRDFTDAAARLPSRLLS